MPGGMAMEFDAGGTRRTRYWTLEPNSTLGKLSLDDAIESSVEKLAAFSRAIWHVKVLCGVTSPADLIQRFLAFFLDRLGLPFEADFVGPSEHEDVRIANTIVSCFGWDHRAF